MSSWVLILSQRTYVKILFELCIQVHSNQCVTHIVLRKSCDKGSLSFAPELIFVEVSRVIWTIFQFQKNKTLFLDKENLDHILTHVPFLFLTIIVNVFCFRGTHSVYHPQLLKQIKFVNAKVIKKKMSNCFIYRFKALLFYTYIDKMFEFYVSFTDLFYNVLNFILNFFLKINGQRVDTNLWRKTVGGISVNPYACHSSAKFSSNNRCNRNKHVHIKAIK